MLPILLYADKTQLSSFGTQKGYPVILRLPNLPSHIRNSDGYGGGQIVGFLPIVSQPFAQYIPAMLTIYRLKMSKKESLKALQPTSALFGMIACGSCSTL